MSAGPHIYVPKHVPLTFPRRQTAPSAGELELRCSECGGTEFKVHVAPGPQGAKLTNVVCATLECQRHARIDDDGCLDAHGRVTTQNGGQAHE